MIATKPTYLTRICMYCYVIIGFVDGKGQSGDSHGICRVCWNKIEPDKDYPTKETVNER